jgi:hypothetical protein
MPGIRVDRWVNVYNSIQLDFPWELIIVSPPCQFPLNKSNVKHFVDYGSPVRASCIAASLAEGKYFTYIADDAIVFSETIKKAINILDNDMNGRLVVVTKYLEACTEVHPDWYYQLNIAYPKTPFIPDNWLIFNTAIMHRDYYEYLGGWDANYETTAVSHADIANRSQRDGCSTILLQDPLLDCTHMPGTSGDHGPIYHAHVEHDEPLYKQIYNSPDCVNRTKIDINNWKKADSIWRRRFG